MSFSALIAVSGCTSAAKQATPARASASIGVLGAFGAAGSPGGVVAVGSATQNVAADLAFVVVTQQPGVFGGLGGSFSLPPGVTLPGGITLPGPSGVTTTVPATLQHDEVRAALRRRGIGAADVEFSPAPASGDGNPSTIRVEVPVAKLPKIANDVVAAIKKIVGQVDSSGLRFAVADCTAVLTSARDKALAAAHDRATALARAAGLTLGPLSAVEESPQQSALSYFSGSVCGRSSATADANPYGGPLAELTAKPEVKLSYSIAAAYALPTVSDRRLAAVGTHEVRVPADEADILVTPGSLQDLISPNSTPSKIDAAKIIRGLGALGISKSAIEVENSNASQLSGATSYVKVHVGAARLAAIGSRIVDAVQSVVGLGASSGVLFSTSKCDAVVAQARVAAIADAGKRLDALAQSTHVQTGAIVGLSESGTSVLVAGLDPCHLDFDSLSSVGLVSGLFGSSGNGTFSLQAIDAAPEVTESVTVTVARAIS